MKNMNIERRKNISNFIVLVCGKSSGCFCLPNNKPVTILYMRNSCYFEIWSWIIHVSAIRLFMPLLLLVLIRITFARTKKSPYQKKKKTRVIVPGNFRLWMFVFVFMLYGSNYIPFSWNNRAITRKALPLHMFLYNTCSLKSAV